MLKNNPTPILLKIVTKIFIFPLIYLIVKPLEEIDEKLNLFSKYHQGMKVDSDSFEKALPEKVANYIANKFKKNSLVIDGVCGIGGNTIQVFIDFLLN